MTPTALVIDTNIVLDLWVFDEPRVAPLRQWLEARALQWLATQPMRDELERVLTYPAVQKTLAFRQRPASDVLAKFDALAQCQSVPGKAPYTCKDPDDQAFIDLAVAHRASLLSKDKAVLCMKKRLLARETIAQTAIEFIASQTIVPSTTAA
jgi:putative PIN family toxin of toxin-antitoxin system